MPGPTKNPAASKGTAVEKKHLRSAVDLKNEERDKERDSEDEERNHAGLGANECDEAA